MRTILGTPYNPPTPDELEALKRQAHRERSQAMRDVLSGLFRWRRDTKDEVPVRYALRPSL